MAAAFAAVSAPPAGPAQRMEREAWRETVRDELQRFFSRGNPYLDREVQATLVNKIQESIRQELRNYLPPTGPRDAVGNSESSEPGRDRHAGQTSSSSAHGTATPDVAALTVNTGLPPNVQTRMQAQLRAKAAAAEEENHLDYYWDVMGRRANSKDHYRSPRDVSPDRDAGSSPPSSPVVNDSRRPSARSVASGFSINTPNSGEESILKLVGLAEHEMPQSVFSGRHYRSNINDRMAKYDRAQRYDKGRAKEPRLAMHKRSLHSLTSLVLNDVVESENDSNSKEEGEKRKDDSSEGSNSESGRYFWQRSTSRKISRNKSLSTLTASGGSDGVANAEGKERKSLSGCLERFVDSAFFDYCSGILIFLNAAMIGVQTDYMARNVADTPPSAFRIIELVFCVVFTAELLLRMAVYKMNFFTMTDWKWNVFDLTLILTQLAEEFMGVLAYNMNMADFSTMRILRVLRLIRIIRLVRVLRLIGELRSIVVSIIGSMRSLCWTVMLLLGVMYLIGVYLTQLTADHTVSLELKEDAEIAAERTRDLRTHYGSIGSSLLTLFQAITGGLNWHIITEPLMDEISPWLSMVICTYIAFSLFALMNIVTGVFVESAMQTAKTDRDMFMLHFVRQLFLKADVDGVGSITWGKFKASLDSAEVCMFFEAMDLDVDEAKDLFRLLDIDGSGEVDFDEFVNGCFRLRGSAKAIDLAAFMAEFGASMKRWDAHAKQVEIALAWMLEAMGAREPTVFTLRKGTPANTGPPSEAGSEKMAVRRPPVSLVPNFLSARYPNEVTTNAAMSIVQV